MYAPYPENMMESIKKVEATRAQRMATEPRRLSADEKDALLKKFHPDYNPDAFAEIKVGPNKGQKAPLELAEMLHSESRLLNEKIDLNKIDYDVDVLVIGGGGAGSSCAIEAHNAGANVMIVTKLRIGDEIFISDTDVFQVERFRMACFSTYLSPLCLLSVTVCPFYQIKNILNISTHFAHWDTALLSASQVTVTGRILARNTSGQYRKRFRTNIFAELEIFKISQSHALMIPPKVALRFSCF